MKYYTFQPQFHDAIRNLVKTSTIRPKQKVRVGERFALRHWLGSPYRSKMGWLGTAVCVQVAPIVVQTLYSSDVEVTIAGTVLDHDDTVGLAHQEGFLGYVEMGQWFWENHKRCPSLASSRAGIRLRLSRALHES